MKLSLFLAIILSTTCLVIGDNVPFIIAGQVGDNGASKYIPSLEVMTHEPLKAFLDEQTAQPTTVFVLKQKIWSTEQLLTKHDGVTCFEQTSKIEPKTYIPAVHNPIDYLSKLGNAVNTYVTSEGSLNQTIELGKSQVVFVQMPEKREDESDCAYWAQCDGIFAHLREKYSGAQGKAVFIWTAEQSEVRHVRKARAVEEPKQQGAAPVADPSFFRKDNLLLYFTSLSIVNDKKETQEVKVTSADVTNATDNGLEVELKAPSVTVKLNVAAESGFWWIRTASVNEKPAAPQHFVGGPIGFSYHCSPAVSFKVNANDTNINGFTFRGLQIQPKFGDANALTRFGDAVDCVGFSSAGIWAGLFVTFLLLFILTIGISWIMDIRTMDRFDDPKGKTITVTATD